MTVPKQCAVTLLAAMLLLPAGVDAQQLRQRNDRDAPRDTRRDRQAPPPPTRPDSAQERARESDPQLQLVPPRDDRRGVGHWKLGVYAEDTNTGVQITSVIRGGAAWNAGLEEGDLIVTVDGYQVGYVGNQLYPLGQELQARADRTGRVQLLVQNHRNDRLVNLTVQLQRSRPFDH